MDSVSKCSVLSWRDFKAWTSQVRELLADVITDDTIAYFTDHPPQYVVEDDLSWLDDIIRTVSNEEIESKELLASRLTQRVALLRAYHACCPMDLDSYRRHGLIPLDVETAHAFARELFCNEAKAPKTAVDEAIVAMDSSLRSKRVWLGLDDRTLIEDCGHYLLYGSEYLLAIAAELTHRTRNTIDYRQFLRLRGKPTIVACNVPFVMMRYEMVQELAGVLLARLFGMVLEPDLGDEPIDFGFEVCQPLPPNNIVGFSHPRNIRDPLSNG